MKASPDRILAGAVLGGTLLSLAGAAFLVPLPWSVLVAGLLLAGELAFYRRLRAERGEDDAEP